MDNGRIMKELKELQEAAKNVYILSYQYANHVIGNGSHSPSQVGRW